MRKYNNSYYLEILYDKIKYHEDCIDKLWIKIEKLENENDNVKPFSKKLLKEIN